MDDYVGLDVLLKETKACALAPGGRVAAQGAVETSPEALATWLGAHAPGAAAIVLESGGLKERP